MYEDYKYIIINERGSYWQGYFWTPKITLCKRFKSNEQAVQYMQDSNITGFVHYATIREKPTHVRYCSECDDGEHDYKVVATHKVWYKGDTTNLPKTRNVCPDHLEIIYSDYDVTDTEELFQTEDNVAIDVGKEVCT